MTYIQKNTREFRNSSTALFLGAFNTFAILYSTQPIFTNLAEEFNLSPASASLSLSAASMTLAISLLIVGSISEVYGRKNYHVSFNNAVIGSGNYHSICS